ncbi:MAG: hypothetical protein AAFX06_01990 [Planctomycetota bacterium]
MHRLSFLTVFIVAMPSWASLPTIADDCFSNASVADSSAGALADHSAVSQPVCDSEEQPGEAGHFATRMHSGCDSDPDSDPHWLDGLDRLDELFQASRAEGGRWFLMEYDFDDRGYNTLHFMGHAPLPLGLSLWGFIDLEGAEGFFAEREDISRHFLELDLKRRVWRDIGLVAELNDLEGPNNEIGRFGFFWQPDMSRFSLEEGVWAGKLRFGIKCFPVQTISRTSQWSFNWNKQFDSLLGGRLSAGGFFDLNHSTSRNVIVTEHQVRFRIAEGMNLITEFRVNEFLADDFGIAPGLQYRF